ncbi:hypothetical protein [Halocatena halophila]|uniref:hypothetical protein n=1 Tax=Halocatena halophila TaxID=2814576 RepID=UPI002ED2B9C0
MLAEPTVLAAAKECLYPDLDRSQDQYAVTETQFTTRTWGGWEIPEAVRSRLAPFNTIQLAAGEPDLLGIGMPALDVLNSEATTTPVTVIEAKGHNSDPSTADVGTGITQAHSHLSEVNLGYVAAPIQSISDYERSLARELNVGVIGVVEPTEATLLEPARVTGGGDFSTTIDAIRFQATPHHLTDASFPVNHPKNYLGYVLAHVAVEETNEMYSRHVINDPSAGRHGAILLGLIDDGPEGETLTHLGAEVVRFARAEEGSVAKALEKFASWKGRQKRFTELNSHWAQLSRSIAIQYEPTQLIVEALECLHGRGVTSATIDDVVQEAFKRNRALTVEVFFAHGRRDGVLTAGGELDVSTLTDPDVYKTGIHFQFKHFLRHVGIVTRGGTDKKTEVLSNEWALQQSVTQETIVY